MLKLRESFRSSERQLEADKEKLVELEQWLEQHEKRDAEIKVQLESITTRKEKTEASRTETKEAISANKKRISETSKEETALRRKRNELESNLEQANCKLRDARADRRQTTWAENFANAVGSMKRNIPGVHGRVIDLCQPKKPEYNVAVTVTLGKMMDAIVCDDEKAAERCVEYMTEQRIGTCITIPMNKVHPKPLAEEMRKMDGTAKLVIDLLNFDSRHEVALMHVCGNTLVCDTLNEARRVAFGGNPLKERVKVVTKDGQVVAKNGVMTGGVSGVEGKAQRWDEKNVEELKRHRELDEKELEDVKRKLKSLPNVLETENENKLLTNKLSQLDSDFETTTKKLKLLESQLVDIRDKVKERLPHKEKLVDAVAKSTEIKETTEVKLASEKDKAFATFCKKYKFSSIKDYEDIYVHTDQPMSNERMKLTKEKDIVEAKLAHEHSRDLARPIEQHQEAMKSAEVQLSALKDERSKLEKALTNSSSEVEKVADEVKTLKEGAEEAETKIKDARTKHKKAQKAMEDLSNEVAKIETEIEGLRANRHSVFQTCRMEEVALPCDGAAQLSQLNKSHSRTSGASTRGSASQGTQGSDDERPDLSQVSAS